MGDLKNLEELIKSLKADISETKNAVTELNNSNKVFINEWKTHKSEVLELKEQVKTLSTTSTTSEKKLENLLQKEKSRSIIIYRIQNSIEFNAKLLENIVKTFTDVNIKMEREWVETVRKLGKTQGKRPMLVIFTSIKYKKHVFQNLKNLISKKIIISND